MASTPAPTDVGRLERYRRELTGYCYRMLGSPFEAEDAVQETLLRAWRSVDRYDENRAALRTWLYSIATNICLDMTRGPQRRARAADLAAPARPGAPLGESLPATSWVYPIPDDRVLDPADVAEARESIRLAFVAALQHLPPRQRAVLILRDVLRWRAAEVAELLDVTVASVTSSLHRARRTMATATPAPVRVDVDRQQLLDRYVRAFERYDVDALVSLLHEDATMSMPPYSWWLRGRADIAAVLRAADAPCAGTRLVPVPANGTAAFAQYRPDSAGVLRAFGLVVVEVSHSAIAELTSFLDPRLFGVFDLPLIHSDAVR